MKSIEIEYHRSSRTEKPIKVVTRRLVALAVSTQLEIIMNEGADV